MKIFDRVVQSNTEPSIHSLWIKGNDILYFGRNGWTGLDFSKNTELKNMLDEEIKNRENADQEIKDTYLPLSGGTMTGGIKYGNTSITDNGVSINGKGASDILTANSSTVKISTINGTPIMINGERDFKLAPLENNLVPAAYLPSYVDDVLEFTTIDSFPETGESGKIYVDTTTNLTYRWSGTQYIEVSKSIGLGTSAADAYPGNLGQQNADNIAALQEDITDVNQTINSLGDTYLPLSGGKMNEGASVSFSEKDGRNDYHLTIYGDQINAYDQSQNQIQAAFSVKGVTIRGDEEPDVKTYYYKDYISLSSVDSNYSESVYISREEIELSNDHEGTINITPLGITIKDKTSDDLLNAAGGTTSISDITSNLATKDEVTEAVGNIDLSNYVTIDNAVGKLYPGSTHGEIFNKYEGNIASGDYSHAEGYASHTYGESSHAEGFATTTNNIAEHAEGGYNLSNNGETIADKTLHSVGFGRFFTPTKRTNAQEIMQNGDHYIYGIGGYDGTNYAEAQTLQEVITQVDTFVQHGGTIDGPLTIESGNYSLNITPNAIQSSYSGGNWSINPSGVVFSSIPSGYLLTNGGSMPVSAIISLTQSAIVDSAPETLDTLNELAAALNDDPNFATTVTNQIAQKADKTTATTSADGLMSSEDKTKLDGITPDNYVTLDGDQIVSGKKTFSNILELGNNSYLFVQLNNPIGENDVISVGDDLVARTYLALDIYEAGNDNFGIYTGGPTDSGFTVLATGDNGVEPLYIAQYGGQQNAGESKLIHNLITLMDNDGNQKFNKVTAESFATTDGTANDILVSNGTTSTLKTVNGESLLGSGDITTPTPTVNAASGTKTIWTGTQSEYEAIDTKDANTLYFITEE